MRGRTVVPGGQLRPLCIVEADGPDVRHAVVHGDGSGRRPHIRCCAAPLGWRAVRQIFFHGHGRAVEPQHDGDGALRHPLRLPHTTFDLGRHPPGRRAHGFGDPLQRTARRRTAVVGLHVLLGAAHMVFRVAQHDPRAQGGRRALHQARLEVHRHHCRPVVHPHRAVGPTLQVDRPAQRVVPHRAQLMALVARPLDLDVLTVAVDHR